MESSSVILSDSEFEKLSSFIFMNYGIKMPLAKKNMLQSRLQQRLRKNNFTSFKEYCNYLFSKSGLETELTHMIDVVSTNKTDFFREPFHFDFLRDEILPKHLINYPNKDFMIWSSASSSGEEAYTICFVIEDFINENGNINYSVLGTDISSRILDKARLAIYDEERVRQMPIDIKKKYLLKSKNSDNKTVRIVPELRKKVLFKRLNLMDNSYQNIPFEFDLIFCRNVLIYFDRNTQEKVINKLCQHLKPGGYFFLGHSESINGLSVPLNQIKPTIYQKI